MSFMNIARAFSQPYEKARISLSDKDAYTLPKRARQLKVISGTAWVSVGLQDVIVRPQETLRLQKERFGITVTALGKQRVEFEISE
jgi:hypothetical protein